MANTNDKKCHDFAAQIRTTSFDHPLQSEASVVDGNHFPLALWRSSSSLVSIGCRMTRG